MPRPALLKDPISDPPYHEVAHNSPLALAPHVSLYNGIYKVKVDGDYCLQITKETPLVCHCKYSVTMGLPCSHLCAIFIKYNGAPAPCVRARWGGDDLGGLTADPRLLAFMKSFLDVQS